MATLAALGILAGLALLPPVAVYYVCGWRQYRGLRLPTAANPGIFSGGIIGESRWRLSNTETC